MNIKPCFKGVGGADLGAPSIKKHGHPKGARVFIRFIILHQG